MADGLAVTAGSGTTVATDDVGGVHYQRVKLSDGTADSATHLKVVAEDAPHTGGDTGLVLMAVRQDTAAALATTDGDYVPLIVDASGQLWVQLATLPDTAAGDLANIAAALGSTLTVSGAITYDLAATLPDTAAGDLASIASNTGALATSVVVTGPLTDLELRATDVPVTLDSEEVSISFAPAVTLPDTLGGDLSTTATATSNLANAVSGSELQVDLVGGTLPDTAAGDLAAIAADAATLAGTVNVPGTAVNVAVATELPAGENVVGLVGASDIVVTVTPTVAAEAHTAGDLLFDSTEIANAVRVAAGTAVIQNITILDKGDQGAGMKLIFANANTDFGTLGSPPDPDDTEAATVIGVVTFDDTDSDVQIDLGASRIHCLRNVGLLVKAAAASTSIWLAAMTTGTPTPASTSDYVIQIGLLRS